MDRRECEESVQCRLINMFVGIRQRGCFHQNIPGKHFVYAASLHVSSGLNFLTDNMIEHLCLDNLPDLSGQPKAVGFALKSTDRKIYATPAFSVMHTCCLFHSGPELQPNGVEEK